MISGVARLGLAAYLAFGLVACIGTIPAAAGAAPGSAQTSAEKIDLNTATLAQLEELPGVGAATAKKIVAGRPYKTPADLAGAGVSQKVIDKLTPLVTVGAAPAAAPTPAPTAGGSKSAAGAAPAGGAKVDLNTATDKELEELPGVGAATAKKIIAGRPFKSVDDLAKAGLPQKTVDKITPLVTFGAAAAEPSKADMPAKESAGTQAPTKSGGTEAASAKVDLNSASQKELEELPGVGAATAKKIIAGRPYSSADALTKAGISAKEVAKLTPLVTAGSAAAASGATGQPPTGAPSGETPSSGAPPAKMPTGATPSPTPQTPPQKGMVWVNLDTKVYHKEGDRWYGKTKNGKFLTEADAKAAGYRESKQDEAKDQKK